MLNYQQTVEYLYASTPVFEKIGAGAYKEGLSNTLALDQHLSHPHRQFKSVHVAGTNGKGSVSHTIAAILQSAGYKVGLYTSPHLVDFRERIRVNGECIDEQSVVDFVARHRAFFEPLHPSFFELTTAMAFDYFAREGVDIAVVEVGLGGRLDCTNIITPLLSVITNISLDHTQFLGNTLAEIASEKAGIIKSGIPVVIGESCEETRPVFEQTAARMCAPILFAEDHPMVVSAEHTTPNQITYHTEAYGNITGELCGDYQIKNANTILAAVAQLQSAGISISETAIRTGFAHVCQLTGLLGRWQLLGERPTVVCDTGHNVGGWQWLSRQLNAQPCHQLRIVFGMVDDKDINTVTDLLPRHAIYYFTRATTKRAIDEQRVMDIGCSKGLIGKSYPSVIEAYRSAINESEADDFIFVGGSSYVVADLLSALQNDAACQNDTP